MDHRLAQGMRLMEQRIGDEFEISEIAAHLGLSLHHFHRLFVSEFGETPAGYLRRIRLDAIAQHLHWTQRSVGSIAYCLGYRSQSSFTRAFTTRFGESPARYRELFWKSQPFPNGHSSNTGIQLREIEGFHLLAKRYVGDLSRLRENWTDFLAALPAGLSDVGKALFIGLFHDDPRITPPMQTRYDCCITVSEAFSDFDGSLAQKGLYLTRTRPGLHGCLDHRGPYSTVEASYRTFTDSWSQRARIACEHPCMEIHAIPRTMQDPEDLSFTILFPIE